jgi:hypothetical protein
VVLDDNPLAGTVEVEEEKFLAFFLLLRHET